VLLIKVLFRKPEKRIKKKKKKKKKEKVYNRLC